VNYFKLKTQIGVVQGRVYLPNCSRLQPSRAYRNVIFFSCNVNTLIYSVNSIFLTCRTGILSFENIYRVMMPYNEAISSCFGLFDIKYSCSTDMIIKQQNSGYKPSIRVRLSCVTTFFKIWSIVLVKWAFHFSIKNSYNRSVAHPHPD
jgi:hypothetical protein